MRGFVLQLRETLRPALVPKNAPQKDPDPAFSSFTIP
jgi:hypothetical protein